jgi:hypothetical protein
MGGIFYWMLRFDCPNNVPSDSDNPNKFAYYTHIQNAYRSARTAASPFNVLSIILDLIDQKTC